MVLTSFTVFNKLDLDCLSVCIVFCLPWIYIVLLSQMQEKVCEVRAPVKLEKGNIALSVRNSKVKALKAQIQSRKQHEPEGRNMLGFKFNRYAKTSSFTRMSELVVLALGS